MILLQYNYLIKTMKWIMYVERNMSNITLNKNIAYSRSGDMAQR